MSFVRVEYNGEDGIHPSGYVEFVSPVVASELRDEGYLVVPDNDNLALTSDDMWGEDFGN